MNINDTDTTTINIDELFYDWEASYKVGPVELRFTGTLDPLKLQFDAYFVGIKFASGEISPSNRNLCVKGKINSSTKVEVCLNLLDNNKEIEITVKVCILGKCTKWSSKISLPVFSSIKADDI